MTVYKEISYERLFDLVGEGETSKVYYENQNGELQKASFIKFSLRSLKDYKWFEKVQVQELAYEEIDFGA